MGETLALRFRRLFLAPIPPETLALTLALGLVIGVFPVYGCPTMMCIAAAILLRPNVPLLHAINSVTGPLQLALLIPFRKLGERILPLSPSTPAAAVGSFTTQAILGWLLLSLPLGLTLYSLLLLLIRTRRPQPES